MTEEHIKRYGVPKMKDFVESVKNSTAYKVGGLEMVIVSLLSDAQEEIANGMSEQARQTINRVKYLVIENGN